MAEATALALAQSIPGLLPLTGMATAFVFMGLLAAIVFFAVVLIRDEYAQSLANEQQYVLVVYVPAIGYLAGALGRLIEQAKNLFASIASLSTINIVQLLLTLVAIVLAVLFVVYQKPIMEGTYTFYECTLYPVLGFLMSVVNVVDLFIAAIIIAPYNWFWVEFWTVTGLVIRVLVECTLAGSWTALINFISAFALGVRDTILCITNFLSTADLINDRINFVPGLTALMGSFETLVVLFDCFCQYLNFFWTDLFALPASPSLINTLDCAGNVFVRTAQVRNAHPTSLTHTHP